METNTDFKVTPGSETWVLVLTPNYWGRGKNVNDAKVALLKACGGTDWRRHVKGNGNKWLVVWVNQPKGLQAPYVNEMGGVCAMEVANLTKRYFTYRGNSVVVTDGKGD